MDGGSRPHRTAPSMGDPEIRGLTSDSRDVKTGYLFAALSGAHESGRRYLRDALARGAAAILTDETPFDEPVAVPVIADRNPRRRLARMAAHFYAPQPSTIAAVTGTNGKTSVAVFTRQIWTAQGLKAASIGTIGLVAPNLTRPGALTTPDPVKLHEILHDLVQAGVEHVALEASSHGLDQFRLDGVTLAAAAFTNLTRDHLDYHGDMEHYFAAKRRLFAELLPASAVAVINVDDEAGRTLVGVAKARGQRVIAYGTAPDAELRLTMATPTARGLAVEITAVGATLRRLELPLLGTFQAMNALAAIGLAIATGTTANAALDVLPRLEGVPGRMELAATHPAGAPLIVDYAHTPDALETALKALRPHTAKRLIVVFGCGGDRDAGKRPQMGAIAARLADIAIVTDDNPRSEDPATIRRAILTACSGGREIGDRRAAIRTAAKLLEAGDLLLIAGKGHESGQIVGARALPFDDRIEARAAVAALGGAA
ncbi:MAG: UDP-N-acetylmuramoyl-L-alanyl-D-glutamate--2,6-diaminopimelate ligase [Alphaproteobacteria bacterium]|nr:UDP-N-acetylmuramoyl-L-alanyl-D-glutamate--2,6-diaminopimelate ligase [Alphaproteobacteria bacterium]